MEFEIYKDLSRNSKTKLRPGFKKLRVYSMCDAKYDGRHKMRLAADIHIINVLISSAYYGVVPLKGTILVYF